MDDLSDIPFPIRFNPLKHHRNYILDMLETASGETIIDQLDQLCNNYIDIYTGMIIPAAIGKEVISILDSKMALSENDFIGWVGSNKGFRQIKLTDNSEWVVRKSVDPERYIHIHPARSGAFTVRFKGSGLKTAFELKTNIRDGEEMLSLENVNRVRMHIGLSPVKKLERNKGILKCYEKFFDAEEEKVPAFKLFG